MPPNAPTPPPSPLPPDNSVIGTIQRLTAPKPELRPTRNLTHYKDAFNLAQKANKAFGLYTSPVESAIEGILDRLQGSEQFPEYLQVLFGYVDNVAELYSLLVQSGNYSPIIFHLAKNGGSGEHFWQSLKAAHHNPQSKTEEQIRNKLDELIEREEQHDILGSIEYRIALRKMGEVIAAKDFMKQYPEFTGPAASVFKTLLNLRQQQQSKL